MIHSFPILEGRSSRVAVASVVPGVLFVLLTWRHGSVWWGGQGVWLHNVDVLAHGGVLYRDVASTMPPLSSWLLATWGALFGTGVDAIWTFTAMVVLSIAVAYAVYCARVAPGQWAVLFAAGGIVFASGQAWLQGPLVTGSYHPSVPIGFLILMVALLARLAGGRPVLVGVFAGLAVLTKQDYWIPAAVIVGWEALGAERRSRALLAPAISALVVLAGVAIVGFSAGWHVIPRIPGGFGMAELYGIGRMLPSWERITVELAALAVAAGVVSFAAALVDRRWWLGVVAAAVLFVIATGVYVLAAQRAAEGIRAAGLPEFAPEFQRALAWEAENGRPVTGLALRRLYESVWKHTPSLLLPLAILAAVAWRWRALDSRRSLLLALVLIALALRVRRGFERAEWYHVLVELPMYALAASLLLPRLRRLSVAVITVAVLLVGARAYWVYGHGWLTREGPWPLVETPRGEARWAPSNAATFEMVSAALDSLDASGEVPVFMHGHSGGVAYWTDRSNPTPLAWGITTAPITADSLEKLLDDGPLIALRPHTYDRATIPVPELSLGTWSQPVHDNYFNEIDLPIFLRLVDGCSSQRFGDLSVYDCT